MMKQEISLSEAKTAQTENGCAEGSRAEVRIEPQPDRTVLEALAEENIFPEAGCSGKGRCGRCRVRYQTGAPLPVSSERHFFSPQELRNGWRLACLHQVDRECRVEPAFVPAAAVEILAEASLTEEDDGNAAGPFENGKDGDWCICIDLGTTTVAMQARSMAEGKVLAVWKGMNPQRRFGSDVVSRMQAAREGREAELKNSVEALLLAGIRQLAAQAEEKRCGRNQSGNGQDGSGYSESAGGLCGIFLAGNTVMEHLLAGLCVEGLSRHPFTPVTLMEQSIRIGTDRVTLLPGLSAFVGADILAGILACRMQKREEVCLFIDLGTNGELVLGNREKMLCTATAAGPAFEGGPSNAAPGTDVIAVIADLMEEGIVDETGLLADPWFETGIVRKQVRMTQEQIRAVQMAKAAVFGGICILAKEYGISLSKISRVWLAGGFGYYLDVKKASRIGLFPRELEGRVEAAGNTSLEGAFLYGRNGGREEAERVRTICHAINLAEHPDFEGIYLEHLNLC